MGNVQRLEISDKISRSQMFRAVTSNAIGSFGYGLFQYGISFMLLKNTSSPISFGMSLVIGPLVSLLLFIPIGNYVDANDHKKIIFWNYIMRLIIFGLLGLALPHFKGIALLIPVALFEAGDAILADIRGATYSASSKQLVAKKYVSKMASLIATFTSATRVLSPVLGVTIYSLFSIESLIIFECLITVISLILMTSLHFYDVEQTGNEELVSDTKKSQLQQFKETLQYMKKRPFVRDTIIAEIVLNFFYTAVVTGSPFIVVNELHLSNQVVALIETGFAMGYLLGSLVTSLLKNQKHFAIKVLGSLFMIGATMVGMGFNFSFATGELMISAIGFLLALMTDFAFSIFDLAVEIRMQSTIDTKILGRVSSTLYSTSFAIMPVGTLVFTGLFDFFDNGSFIFVVAGMLLIAYAIMSFKLFKNDIAQDDQYVEMQNK